MDTAKIHLHLSKDSTPTSLPTPPTPEPLATTNLISISIILSFPECYINRVASYVVILGLAFLTQHNSLETYLEDVACINSSFLSTAE